MSHENQKNLQKNQKIKQKPILNKKNHKNPFRSKNRANINEHKQNLN